MDSPSFLFSKLKNIFQEDLHLQGRFSYDMPMEQHTWFQVGGPLGCLFCPKNWRDLQYFLGLLSQQDLPSFLYHREDVMNMTSSHFMALPLGAGSNLLVRDGGMPQDILVKLGKGFHQVHIFPQGHKPKAEDIFLLDAEDAHKDQGEEKEEIQEKDLSEKVLAYFGASLLDRYVAQFCQSRGFSGLEFLYTIPGTIGGGLFMNAGCFGADFSTHLVGALVMDPQGDVHYKSKESLHYGYRSCSLKPGWFFLGGYFSLTPDNPLKIAEKMEDHVRQRNETQPTHVKTGGSTFGNPPGFSAWSLVDAMGFRGKTLGKAQWSPKHCNFLVNQGGASAQDLETLGQETQEEVLKKKGAYLPWEIVRWGKKKL